MYLLICAGRTRTGRWKLLLGHPWQSIGRRRGEPRRRGVLLNTAERRRWRGRNQRNPGTVPHTSNQPANLQVCGAAIWEAGDLAEITHIVEMSSCCIFVIIFTVKTMKSTNREEEDDFPALGATAATSR